MLNNEKLKQYLKIYLYTLSILLVLSVAYISPILATNVPKVLGATPNNSDQIQNDGSAQILNKNINGAIVSKCTGSWIYTPAMGQTVELDYVSINGWSNGSKPSIVTEYMNKANSIVLGHNVCKDGNCNQPGTVYSRIIYTKPGEYAEACIDGNYYKGEVIVSKAVVETDIYILDDYLNQDVVTAMTCYGNCKDANCALTDQRWIISFKKY